MRANNICGEDSLACFRDKWDGQAVLQLLETNDGRLRINWAVGVGKSYNMDKVIEEAITSNQYDLVIVLCPTRQIVEERKWIKTPPRDVAIVNLRPRPIKRCSADLNAKWRKFEKQGLGRLGRIDLCNNCPSKKDCYWPDQYGGKLEGSQVIYGTQAHLQRAPDFLDTLALWVKAKNVLVVLDEANFIMTPFRRTIKQEHLRRFVEILKKSSDSSTPNKYHQKWLYISQLLLNAPTEDLRNNEWFLPIMSNSWSLAIQQEGYDTFNDLFFFLAFDLINFSRSPIDSREKSTNGDITFATVPQVNMNFILYSGTAHQHLTENRLGSEFANPFQDYSFSHPKTEFFNIRSLLGAKKYFKKNSDQILDFFVSLIAKRLQEGKRPLLLAKKCFVPFCAQQISEKLLLMGVEANVISGDWNEKILSDTTVIPIINYGMIGTNLFQDFDSAYCLTSYYVNEQAVDSLLQDLLGSDMNIPIKIKTEGFPRTRTAEVRDRKDRIYDVHSLAPHALNLLEMDTVLQAVGRVRPYTKPREIIMFQCSDHPTLEIAEEFHNIQEARTYFGIKKKRSTQAAITKKDVQHIQAQGKTQRETAELLKLGLRTVQRYWQQ